MELKANSSRSDRQSRPGNSHANNSRANNSYGINEHPFNARPVNECAQCRETIFLPEWSEYLDARRVRHLWECEACGYKFETLVCFPEL
jgi:hypothetical protein